MITVDLDHAKQIAHERRRRMRDAEFEPHDAVIAKQIPGQDKDLAEAMRMAIRAKYHKAQADIDSAQNIEELQIAESGYGAPR